MSSPYKTSGRLPRPLPVRPSVLALICVAIALASTWARPVWAKDPNDAAAANAEQLDKVLDRRELVVNAVRVKDADIVIDGRVDEQAWRSMSPLPELIQSAPAYGAPASRRTEVRLAYGDRGVYASFVCYAEPGEIRAPFFVRDRETTSDSVTLELDTNDDDTTGFEFKLTPSGAILDSQLNRDVRAETLWDGVWQSAARKLDDRWTAEMFIPWSTLRFEAHDDMEMGFNVGRFVNATGESLWLSAPPQGIPGRVSYHARWRGITGVDGGLNVELRPFASGRFALRRPDGALDQTWRALPNGGFDLKYALKGSLTLDVAVNPDFGQAEVDPAFLNLGPFEVFLPEKRQFFLESKEIFETNFSLFYTRRIGAAPSPRAAKTTERTVDGAVEEGELVALDPQSRILNSVRVTGEVAPGWTLGLLTATTGPTFGEQRFTDQARQRVPVDPLTQWSVVRLRRQFDSRTYVGGLVTGVVRADGEPSAFTGGVDYNVQFRKRWFHTAQVIGTHDGERSGMGAQMGLNRTSRRTRFDINGETLTPHANFNDLGFMLFADYAQGIASAQVFNAQPIGAPGRQVRELGAGLYVHGRSDYQGRVTRKLGTADFWLTTMGLWRVTATVGGHLPELDPYETRGNIPYEIPLHWWSGIDVDTPSNKRVTASFGTSYGEQDGNPGPDARLRVGVRPVDRLQIDVGTEFNFTFNRPRWVAQDDAEQPIFGRARTARNNLDVRMTLGILPTLSISTWNQFLYVTAHHTDFFVLDDPQTLTPTDPAPWTGLVDQGLTSLVSNTILRWEYLPGSFVFLAYTHRTRLGEGGMRVDYVPGRWFTNLGREGAAREDTLFVKLVHLFTL